MEGRFNSITEFEEVLYKTIEKTGEISLVKFMSELSAEEKNKIKELYGVEKPGAQVIKILQRNPQKYVFTSKEGTAINNWVFKTIKNDNNTTQEIQKNKSVQQKSKKTAINRPKDENDVSKEEKETIKLKKEDVGFPREDNPPEEISSEKKEEVLPVDEKLKEIVMKDMVLINDTFYISKFLVTQELYESVIGENPSTFKDEPVEGENQKRRPVETVSYLEATEFCNQLSKKCGFASCYKATKYLTETNGFRLPTESEWNSVAMTKKTKFAGSDVPDGFAWYKHNSKNKTHEVGKKRPVMINDSDGVYDMSGNVWEWVMSDKNTDKTLCIGGSYEDSGDYLELGKRMNNKSFPNHKTKNSTIGFRICVNFLK